MHKRAAEKFHAADLFDGARWLCSVTLEVNAAGTLVAVRPDTPPPAGAEVLRGPVLPGMPNAHSHAFQRAMAGQTEARQREDDSFWSWREGMYRLAAGVDPDDLEAIAAQVFVEMLQAGYTSVCEFHYLHRDPAGSLYADPAELGLRVLEAAAHAGIGVTLLPVLYQQGGFGGRGLSARQGRFYLSRDEFMGVAEAVAAASAGRPDQHSGVAFHSLRAVSAGAIGEVLDAVRETTPVHIHIAEQRDEVSECLAHTGSRPVAWLADHVDLGPRWALIHATHMDAVEAAAVARSRAVIGLCPSTEANLGDGFFPLADYLAGAGAFAIGSDSHISVSPSEELRWLEYGNRLRTGRRNTVADAGEPRCGTFLWSRALAGGAQAAGRAIGRLAPGARADWLVIDPESALLVSSDRDALLDSLVFSGNRSPVRDVMVGGRWRVRDSRHPEEDSIRARFLEVSRRLNADAGPR